MLWQLRLVFAAILEKKHNGVVCFVEDFVVYLVIWNCFEHLKSIQIVVMKSKIWRVGEGEGVGVGLGLGVGGWVSSSIINTHPHSSHVGLNIMGASERINWVLSITIEHWI